jgi:hypothetical protein
MVIFFKQNLPGPSRQKFEQQMNLFLFGACGIYFRTPCMKNPGSWNRRNRIILLYPVVSNSTTKLPFKTGLPAAETKKVSIFHEKPRSSFYFGISWQTTAFRAPWTINSGMGNPNLRTEFLFYVDYMLTGNQKSEWSLHNATF